MAGVSMPSPINIHMPSIAMKNNTLLAIKLLSINIPSLLGFSNPWCKLLYERLDCEFTLVVEVILPMFICLQSNEYRANVPPGDHIID